MSQHPNVEHESSRYAPTEPVSAEAAETYPGSSEDSATAQILEGERDSRFENVHPSDPDGDSGSGSSSTVDAAKEQGQQVGQEAVQGGQHVASVTADQAKSVASEAAGQAKDLLGEAKSQLSEQAATQQGNLATWLHSLADELHSLTDKIGSSSSVETGAQGGDGSSDTDRPAAAAAGFVTDFASRTSGQVKGAADWLEKHDPADLLEEATRFARQRPGTFLAVAAVAGVVAGRLTRGLSSESKGTGDEGQAQVQPFLAESSTGTTGPVDISAAPEAIDTDLTGAASFGGVTTERPWATDAERELTATGSLHHTDEDRQ